MTRIQRIIVSVGVLLIAIRAFLPASNGSETGCPDWFTYDGTCVSLSINLLHIMGIAALTWAAYTFAPK